MSHKLTMTVPVRDGRCQFTEQQLAAIHQHLQKRSTVMVTFAKPQSTRSLKQNAYLWGVVYREISQHTGMTTEDVHEVMKDYFLPRRFVKLGSIEKEIQKSTADLSPSEFGEYLERVTTWAGQELGIVMPVEATA